MSIQDWCSGLSAVGTCLTAYIAWKQLSNLNKSLNDSNLMTIFEVEFELNRRKEKLAEIRNESEKMLLNIEGNISDRDKAITNILESHRKEAYENYLNIFDRLCYFILHKKLSEEDFRLDYRDMLFKTIEEDRESSFMTGTKYRNMIKVYDSWKSK